MSTKQIWFRSKSVKVKTIRKRGLSQGHHREQGLSLGRSHRRVMTVLEMYKLNRKETLMSIKLN
jgi:hypothetical protein